MDTTQQQQPDVVGQSSAQSPASPSQPVVQSPQSLSSTSPGAAPVVPPSIQPDSTQFPTAAPVGSVAKEQAPLAPITDYVRPADHTEQQVEISKEMAEVGVEHARQVEHPQLTVEDKRAGLEVTKASVPVSHATGTSVKLPYTQEEAVQGRKTAGVGSSLRWLFETVIRELKKTQLKLTQKEEK